MPNTSSHPSVVRESSYVASISFTRIALIIASALAVLLASARAVRVQGAHPASPPVPMRVMAG